MAPSYIDNFFKRVTIDFHCSLDTQFHKGLIMKDIYFLLYT